MSTSKKQKTNFQKYLCVDPSFFSSVKRFDTLPDVLNNLKNSESKIVLPSSLKPLSPHRDDYNERLSTDLML